MNTILMNRVGIFLLFIITSNFYSQTKDKTKGNKLNQKHKIWL